MKLRRRLPAVAELRPLLQLERPTLDRTAARLAKAADVADLRAIAKRRTPRPAFDYVDGAALAEITAAKTRRAFHDVELVPRVLKGTSRVDTTVKIAGRISALPFGIAPTGFTRFMHAEGEDAGASAASRQGVPFALSTMGTRSVEEVAAASGAGQRWFQLYLWKDRNRSRELMERAWAHGFDTLLVTVDTPVAGLRLRDVRNGMSIPPRLNLATIADAAIRPHWWFNFLTTDPLTFASLSSSTSSLPELINSMFDPTLSWADLEWIRGQWPGQLFVKGVLTPQDAQQCVAAGADGLVVSSHGGRQLDRSVVPLHQLPVIREAVGPDTQIVYDSGILSGTDVVTALCLGADFTMVGRAYLYGLMAGGESGVTKMIQILAREIEVTMHLLGVSRVAELNATHVHRGPADSAGPAETNTGYRVG
ncbi:alpha-hydroxy acid oxidase [Kocuria sp.]|uniref:alpha-hydroxy acid oxidase n=1 Tax=Kocuria sp. TaxID=1871328 RepID=UPI0026E06BEF|nr:alpha-hydroxy acid oxidase [Kocuria sp.]MDO5619620.1 alpha-hydroxy acid oxidase [Kocuria sp.]